MASAELRRRVARHVASLLGLALTSHAWAGGPLYVVPSGGSLAPARWVGEVPVYTDRGTLGVLDNATANAVVARALQQWSSVPTSSFRAKIKGSLPVDIVGANAGTVIGAANGGGVQVIYDSDGSVLSDFLGVGYGVLGVATPEILEGEGSTRIVEAWVVLRGEEDYSAYAEWYPDMHYVPGEPTSGIVTHEFGHAINLAHSQTNGYYSRNQGAPEYGLPDGPEQAGPDQCGKVAATYPTTEQIETMYPMIDPLPFSATYDSPQMATVNLADDRAALSSIYPAANFASTTGTLRGRVVAKDGTSPLTGINLIARRVDQGNRFDAMSRISGDLTQGLLGPDGNFQFTGLVPGASYVVYIDQIADGGFSTPKAVLLGPEEYWNAGESGDASQDDACAATPISLAAGEVRDIVIAMNGIPRAPTFTSIPYVLASNLSDHGDRIAGVFSTFHSPFWLWDKQNGTTMLGGTGFIAAISGNGRVVGGGLPVDVETPYGVYPQEYAALWTRERGWTSIAPKFAGCDIFQSTIYDLSTDGSVAVGLAFQDCRNAYAFKWSAKAGFRLLPKSTENRVCKDPYSGDERACEGSSRANGVSANGAVVVGWEELPEAYSQRVGSIWQGNEQMLLRDPDGTNPLGGWVGEVQGVNSAGTVAVGGGQGPELNRAYRWSTSEGVVSLGQVPGTYCFIDWFTGELVCTTRDTTAISVSDDGKVITGDSAGEGAIYTPKLGWMTLAAFLDAQGVLEASRWQILGSRVSADGKTLAGTALPLAADYYQGFRLQLDQVFVCHGAGRTAQTLRVGFPDAMDLHLSHGDKVGLCAADRPL